MLHRGSEETQATNVRRWKSGRGWPFRGRRPSVAGRSFDEDLALFERQAREEAGEERTAGPISPAALSA